MTDKSDLPLYFGFFNEVGIIQQLSSAMLEARLPDGLLTSHFAVLNHLVRVKDGQTPLVLARAFQVPKTTMTHTLGILEKHGLVELRPNPKDGRSKCVWLTEEGKALRIRSIEAMAPDLVEFAERFPPQVMAEILPKLSDIRDYMDKARDED